MQQPVIQDIHDVKDFLLIARPIAADSLQHLALRPLRKLLAQPTQLQVRQIYVF